MIVTQLVMGVLNVLLLPLPVLAAALNVGHERVKGNRLVMGGPEVEGRADFQSAVAAVAMGFIRRF